MVDFYGEDVRMRMDKQADNLIEQSLSLEVFSKEFLDKENNNFWVACSRGDDSSIEGDIMGCVGVKRVSPSEAELVRMAVRRDIRSKGVGSQLLKELIKYCEDTQVENIFLETGNPLAAEFYARNGFTVVKNNSVAFNERITFQGVKMVMTIAK
eukprot:gene40096-48860_t